MILLSCEDEHGVGRAKAPKHPSAKAGASPGGVRLEESIPVPVPVSPLALLALPCSLISRATPRTLQTPEKKMLRQPQPHWSKNPELERAGIPPLWHLGTATHPSNTKIFQLCYLSASTQHTPNFPKDKACPISSDAQGWEYEKENHGGCSRCFLKKGPSPGCARWF